jgi:hypothetical protein
MVYNTTYNNISAWRSVLLVKETGVPGEDYIPLILTLMKVILDYIPLILTLMKVILETCRTKFDIYVFMYMYLEFVSINNCP